MLWPGKMKERQIMREGGKGRQRNNKKVLLLWLRERDIESERERERVMRDWVMWWGKRMKKERQNTCSSRERKGKKKKRFMWHKKRREKNPFHQKCEYWPKLAQAILNDQNAPKHSEIWAEVEWRDTGFITSTKNFICSSLNRMKFTTLLQKHHNEELPSQFRCTHINQNHLANKLTAPWSL